MSNSVLRDSIIKIFQTVQNNKTTFKKQFEKLKQLYKENGFNNFVEPLTSLLKHPLSIGESSSKIDNILEFAAKFCVSVDENSDDNPLLNKIFEFLVYHHDVRDREVRYRICNFLAILLNSMGEDAIVDDDLYDRISNAMLERIQDKSPKVRVQAVIALQRLQDPEIENCPIINVYIYHMLRDPSADVREKILNVIAKTKKTLGAALKKINDINASVRKAAYKFISRVTVRSLTISQRETILKYGLKDSSAMVVDAIKKILLPSWLRHFNNDYVALLKGLDVENSLETSILTLKTLFEREKRPWRELMEFTEVNETTRLISIDKISSEKVLFWRCLIEFVHKISEDEMENILPELTPFCAYIQDYINYIKAKRYEFWEEKSQEFILFQLFEIIRLYDLSDESGKKCLKQLLLNTLKHSHQSERIVDCIIGYLETIIPNIHERIETLLDIINELRMPMQLSQIQTQKKGGKLSEKDRHTIKMQLARLKVELLEYQEEEYNAIQSKKYLLAEELKEKITLIQEKMNKLIEETTEPDTESTEEVCQERNDPETLISCLRIMTSVMKSAELKVLTPVLRTLMENLALVNIHHPDKVIRRLALLFLGICCTLDEQLAKKHIFSTFLVQFSLEQECPEICGQTLKIIFDLLCIFGLKHFNISYDNEDQHDKSSRRSRTIRLYNNNDDSLTGTKVEATDTRDSSKIMQFLINLMDNENIDCRKIATTGLVKLLANEIILNARLLSRVLIQLHNPSLKSDSYLLQYIIKFLNYFAREVPQSQELLRDSYFITLRILENETDSLVYQEVNQDQITDLILILTRSENQKSGFSNVHNELVYKIIIELLDDDSDLDKEVLLKTLPKLHLKFESLEDQKDLLDKLNNVALKLQDNYSRSIKHIENFKTIINQTNTEVQPVDNISNNRIIDALREEISSHSEPEMMEIED